METLKAVAVAMFAAGLAALFVLAVVVGMYLFGNMNDFLP